MQRVRIVNLKDREDERGNRHRQRCDQKQAGGRLIPRLRSISLRFVRAIPGEKVHRLWWFQ